MNARELHKKFKSSYPFVVLSLRVVVKYIKTAKNPNIEDLFDYAVSNGLIEEEIEL